MVQTTRSQIKAYKIQIEKNAGITIHVDSSLLTCLPRHAAWQHTRFNKRQGSTPTAHEKIRHMSYQNPILLVGEAVSCRRPGALVNKLESAWLEDVWLGRDSTTDEQLIGTPNGMVRSRALKRRVERPRWRTTLLNAMVWDPWKPTPVTRGRQRRIRRDCEPTSMRPIPKVHFNLPDDPDTATSAAAAPSQETTWRETTQSVAETRVRPAETEAEGAPPVQRTRTAVTTSETTTTSPARALVERVGYETGEDSQTVQMRRIVALMAECGDTTTSDAVAEAHRKHLDKLTKVQDAVIKVVPRTDATTRHLKGRWVESVLDDGARKARWTTRGYEQTLNGNEDFLAMMHFTMMLVDAALKGHVVAIGSCSGGPSTKRFSTPTEQRAKCGSSRLQRQSWDLTACKILCRHSLESRVPRERGTRTVRTFSRVPMRWTINDTTVAFFYRFGPLGEHIEEKAGRHIDDFLVTGPEQNVDGFLKQAGDKLNVQDAVRLYRTSDECRLAAMNIRKMEHESSLQGKPLLIRGIATALGVENATASSIPETINEKAQDGDDESLTPEEARIFKTCVEHQSSSPGQSAQREHTFQINEESDCDSNAMAQEGFLVLAWHE